MALKDIEVGTAMPADKQYDLDPPSPNSFCILS